MQLITSKKHGVKIRVLDECSQKTRDFLCEQADKFMDMQGEKPLIDESLIQDGKLQIDENIILHNYSANNFLLWDRDIYGTKQLGFYTRIKNILSQGLKTKASNEMYTHISFNDKETNYVVDVFESTKKASYTESINDHIFPTTGYLEGTTPYFPVADLKTLMDKSIHPQRNMNPEDFKNPDYFDECEEKYGDGAYSAIQKATSHLCFVVDGRSEEFKKYTTQNGEAFTCEDTEIKKDLVGELLKEKGWDYGHMKHKGFVFGIPQKFIVGVVFPYHQLFLDNFNKLLFPICKDRMIISPTGEILHNPNLQKNKSAEEQYEDFLKAKNKFLEEQKRLIKQNEETLTV